MRKYLHLLSIVFIITGCFQNRQNKIQPQIKNGTIDLSAWDLEKDGSIELKGNWGFFWKKFISPEEFYKQPKKFSPENFIKVPKPWNSYHLPGEKKKKVGADGYASYYLKIKGLPDSTKTDLFMKLKYSFCAYSIYFIPGTKVPCIEKNKSEYFQPVMKNGVVAAKKKMKYPRGCQW